ncbi:hypothetical protein EGW08_018199 [Elysia chlorotica]|uniref:DUF4371 domain-containing protein n=1 Tax=Elysia chlorotica TaxID=188477 RepID=A0A433SY02_ELYCH|nr:hypothetical protein EGW08_018199 [Elysia chlorotica]
MSYQRLLSRRRCFAAKSASDSQPSVYRGGSTPSPASGVVDAAVMKSYKIETLNRNLDDKLPTEGKLLEVILCPRPNSRDLLDEMEGDVLCSVKGTSFPEDLFNAYWQYDQYKYLLNTLMPGEILFVEDFAVNRKALYSEEVKSAHFGKRQITIHPIVTYYKRDDFQLARHALMFMSADINHDYHMVNYFTRMAINHLKRHSGGPKPNVWPESTAGFFGSEHRKGEADGETGVLSQALDRAVKFGLNIHSAKDLYQWAAASLTKSEGLRLRTFLFSKEGDVNRDRPTTDFMTILGEGFALQMREDQVCRSIEISRLAEMMRKRPFSIATDGSNDTAGGNKYYPLVVRVSGQNGVETGLLTLANCEGQSTGCLVHLVHIAARKGAAHLGGIEEVLVEAEALNKYLRSPTNRLMETFLNYSIKLFNPVLVKLHASEPLIHELFPCTHNLLREILTKFVKPEALIGKDVTKVLPFKLVKESHTACVDRLLRNWEPLCAYFNAERTRQKSPLTSSKAEALNKYLRSPTNRLMETFLNYSIKLFNPVLVKLHASEPLINELLPCTHNLLREILTKFVKPEALIGKDVTKVNFEDPNLQREDRDLGIGVAALGFIQDKDRNNLRESRLPDFYLAVRRFYKEIASYLLKSLP